ncbi:universal stress protein [Granulosicoccus sp. 3-233]|uniref:universal stress protein n=1 Tax=Granulosicoccus sp. 3-233 TaxID=3417969 RepID=UPI003D34EFB3
MIKIIAVIDGSSYSASVCEHAAWVANRAGASIEVIHVLTRRDASADQSNLSGSIGLGARSALLSELAELDAQQARLAQKRGRAILVDAESLLSERGVSNVHTRLRNGEIVDTVKDMEDEADLIVMGKRGESANFDTLHLGPNLEKVIRSTRKPVMVASREFTEPSKILIAFDGGPSALKAVEFVSKRPHYNDLPIHLLSVGRDSANERRQLEGAVITLKEGGFAVTGENLPGTPESVIADKVEQEGFDLVIMGAYGHSRIRNLIIGSTTTEMVRSCKVPVLLFR